MKIIRAEELLDLLLQAAKEDARGTTTGWARLDGHRVRCAYYPASGTHRYWLGEPCTEAEAIKHLANNFSMKTRSYIDSRGEKIA